MNLQSVSVNWTTGSQFLCPCRDGNRSYRRNKGFVQKKSFLGFVPCYWNPVYVNSRRCSVKTLVYKRIDYEEFVSSDSNQMSSNFTSVQEDPMINNLRAQIGVIHPIPLPPINGQIAGMLMLFFFVGVVFDKLWTLIKKDRLGSRGMTSMPKVPTSFFLLSEKDLQRKESVEWVNMVLAKLWKVYRTGIENWVISSLQPVVEKLEKPSYVERIELKQFLLGEEPLVVRNIERVTTRRTNDLQYQLGLRYTGGARLLLALSLKFGIVPITLPVVVRDFDIDGEVWVKLRLMPSEPWGWLGTLYASLSNYLQELSFFFAWNGNTSAIPVLSMFMKKLLTEDLPRKFVLPNKIVLDFEEGTTDFPVSNDFGSGEFQEGDKDFVGELSVTLVDARQLPYVFYGKTDPYVVLRLGDQVIHSKRNTQTSFTGPPGAPIWNQDFHMLVANPREQKLIVQVKDSLGFTDLIIGSGEIELGSLEDTVPTDTIVTLQGGWGLFNKGSSGEILLRLTYRACCEDEEDDGAKMDLMDDELSNDEQKPTYEHSQRVSNPAYNGSFMDELAALLVGEKFQRIISSDLGSAILSEDSSNIKPTPPAASGRISDSKSGSESSDSPRGSALFWFGIFTITVAMIAINVGGSSFFNP